MNSFDQIRFISDFITEDADIFNEGVILETIKDQIRSIAQRIAKPEEQDQTTFEELEKYIEEYAKLISDPYWKWVINQIAKGNLPVQRRSIYFRPETNEDHSPYKFQRVLANYARLAASKKIPLEYRDINRIGSLDELKTIIAGTAKQSADNLKRYGDLLAVNNEYALLRIYDPRSVEEIGHNTAWCTRAGHPQCRSENYIEDFGYLYIVMSNKDTGAWKPYIQFTPDLAEVQDTKKYNATYPLLDVLLSLDFSDEELIIDLIHADSFIYLLKKHRDEEYKKRLISIYIDAMVKNYKDSGDQIYLDKIKWIYKYFQLNSPEDDKRLDQIEDMFYVNNDEQENDTPF